MRVMVLGAGGMLAHDLARAALGGATLTLLTRSQLDIRDEFALSRAIEGINPDWVLNAAAFTDVDAAERDAATAFAVNATAVGVLARLCRARGTRLVHFSTDYVFDGENPGFYSENDEPRPVNSYGKSKLAGEQLVRESRVKHLLIRTQSLFGSGGKSFVGLMCERALAREPTRVVADQLGSCMYAVDLAQVTWELIGRFEGTVHVANRGHLSRFALAKRIFDHFNASELVTSCTTEEFGREARRPLNSALSVRAVERMLGRKMPTWEDALLRFVSESGLSEEPKALRHGARLRA